MFFRVCTPTPSLSVGKAKYCPGDEGALYLVPVRLVIYDQRVTSPEHFRALHKGKSYHYQRQQYTPDQLQPNGRKKRTLNTNLLLSVADALATLMQHFKVSQLTRVFVGGRCRLNALARPYLQEADGNSAIGDALKKLTKSRKELFNEAKYTHVKELFLECAEQEPDLFAY